jgi:hypothetical protein
VVSDLVLARIDRILERRGETRARDESLASFLVRLGLLLLLAAADRDDGGHDHGEREEPAEPVCVSHAVPPWYWFRPPKSRKPVRA